MLNPMVINKAFDLVHYTWKLGVRIPKGFITIKQIKFPIYEL